MCVIVVAEIRVGLTAVKSREILEVKWSENWTKAWQKELRKGRAENDEWTTFDDDEAEWATFDATLPFDILSEFCKSLLQSFCFLAGGGKFSPYFRFLHRGLKNKKE